MVADIKYEMKRLGSLTFHCVLQALARKEERGQKLIILYAWKIISNEFLLFSMHSMCWMQDTKFE